VNLWPLHQLPPGDLRRQPNMGAEIRPHQLQLGNNDGVPKYRRRSGRARWPNTAATIGLAVTHASVMTPMTASAGGDETYGGSDGELRPAQVPSLDVTRSRGGKLLLSVSGYSTRCQRRINRCGRSHKSGSS
ncbi:Hypothetical protein SMAX5B_005490, partial [Scophthalmus maximus]